MHFSWLRALLLICGKMMVCAWMQNFALCFSLGRVSLLEQQSMSNSLWTETERQNGQTCRKCEGTHRCLTENQNSCFYFCFVLLKSFVYALPLLPALPLPSNINFRSLHLTVITTFLLMLHRKLCKHV